MSSPANATSNNVEARKNRILAGRATMENMKTLTNNEKKLVSPQDRAAALVRVLAREAAVKAKANAAANAAAALAQKPQQNQWAAAKARSAAAAAAEAGLSQAERNAAAAAAAARAANNVYTAADAPQTPTQREEAALKEAAAAAAAVAAAVARGASPQEIQWATAKARSKAAIARNAALSQAEKNAAVELARLTGAFPPTRSVANAQNNLHAAAKARSAAAQASEAAAAKANANAAKSTENAAAAALAQAERNKAANNAAAPRVLAQKLEALDAKLNQLLAQTTPRVTTGTGEWGITNAQAALAYLETILEATQRSRVAGKVAKMVVQYALNRLRQIKKELSNVNKTLVEDAELKLETLSNLIGTPNANEQLTQAKLSIDALITIESTRSILSSVPIPITTRPFTSALKKYLSDLRLPANWGKNISTNLTKKAANLGRAAMAPSLKAAQAAYPYVAAPVRYLRNKFYPSAAAKAVAAPVAAVAAAAPAAAVAAPPPSSRGFFGKTYNRARNTVYGTPTRQAQRRLERAEKQLDSEVYSVKAAQALVNAKFGTNNDKAAAAAKLNAAKADLKAAQGERNAANAAYKSFTPKAVGGRSRKNRRNSRKNRTRRNNY